MNQRPKLGSEGRGVNVKFWVWRIAIYRLTIAAYGVRQRLFAVQSSLGLKHGIRSLATNPVYVAIKLIDDTRSRQTVESLAQEPLILLPRVGLGKGPSLEF